MTSHVTCSVLNCKRPNKYGSVFCIPNYKQNWDLFVHWWRSTGNPKYAELNIAKAQRITICEVHFTQEQVNSMKRRIKTVAPSRNLPAPLDIKFDIAIPQESTTEVLLPMKRTSSPIPDDVPSKRQLLQSLDAPSTLKQEVDFFSNDPINGECTSSAIKQEDFFSDDFISDECTSAIKQEDDFFSDDFINGKCTSAVDTTTLIASTLTR